jgi:hypothetical protein
VDFVNRFPVKVKDDVNWSVNGRTYFVVNMFAYSRKVSTVERLKGQFPEILKNEGDENNRTDPHGK